MDLSLGADFVHSRQITHKKFMLGRDVSDLVQMEGMRELGCEGQSEGESEGDRRVPAHRCCRQRGRLSCRGQCVEPP